jgi:hypothetical protein
VVKTKTIIRPSRFVNTRAAAAVGSSTQRRLEAAMLAMGTKKLGACPDLLNVPGFLQAKPLKEMLDLQKCSPHRSADGILDR